MARDSPGHQFPNLGKGPKLRTLDGAKRETQAVGNFLAPKPAEAETDYLLLRRGQQVDDALNLLTGFALFDEIFGTRAEIRLPGGRISIRCRRRSSITVRNEVSRDLVEPAEKRSRPICREATQGIEEGLAGDVLRRLQIRHPGGHKPEDRGVVPLVEQGERRWLTLGASDEFFVIGSG